jgi:hypothetical protein
LVRGLDVEGREFQESTETIDISESGISFLLNTSIWMDSHLTIEIRHSQVFGPCSVQKAKVVRLRSQPDGKQLVGARFD